MRYGPSSGLKAAIVGAALLAGGGVMTPAVAEAPALAMLDNLTPGAWELRDRATGEVRKLCLKNGRDLIQIKHRQPPCNRFVAENSASMVTVQYTCRGNGYGRTTIRSETPTLVQISTQGIADGRPFDMKLEARRTGACR
ncbi:hypothetical protein EB810_01510 [Altererythrobacter sp. FM1]|uniref:DUF3617 family protein n=1 Tax=Tsuneonella flava TaxID=2055955 RepID=A0ABX7KAC4_9SPHN|nr:DUF3617 family protein [Tsuneonella flava]QSB44927.1 hypothetical protein IDJ81_01780 [Tsuneonella flava]ROT96658.1 hypothetical protein EB810_01510 [Altererythrobacter sp. FM1]